MKKKIVIVGCGGFGREVLQVIKQINLVTDVWDVIGFFDDSYSEYQSKLINGIPLLGNVQHLSKFSNELNVVIGVGNAVTLHTIFSNIDLNKFIFPNIIHPSVMFDYEVNKIGYGNIISRDCIVTCNVQIGNFNNFNVNAVVGHDVHIGNLNIIGPKVQISGMVHIGNGNQWGMCSGVIQNKKIGNNNYIGGFSYLIQNISNNNSYFGIPATKQIY
jgi:sugar O-acyltransferase (sialic acid O-acetyltransferase NeuD family)